MLKIKDNVDLKELEKYGYNEGIIFPLGTGYIKQLEYGDFISIQKSRYIDFEFNDWCGKDYDRCCEKLVDDLIKDGLVEKVDD